MSTNNLMERRSALAACILLVFAMIAAHMAWLNSDLPVDALFAPPSDVTVSRTGIYRYLFLAQDSFLGLAGLAVVMLAFCGVGGAYGQQLAKLVAEKIGHVALLCTLVLVAGSLHVYMNHPLAMDEYAPVFQAHVFAQGELTWKFPPQLLTRLIPPGFWNMFLVVGPNSGQVASIYWPGQALLMAPFAFVGMPSLLNPILSGISLWLIAALARKISGQAEVGGWAALFTLASPVFSINGISYYSMPAHLCFNLLFIYLVWDPPSKWRMIAAGLVGAVALNLHNPIPHLLFALPWWAWLIFRKKGWQQALLLALGYLPLCMLLSAGWLGITGRILAEGGNTSSPLSFSFQSLGDFLTRIGMVFPDARILRIRWMALEKVWMWAVPGLLILAFIGIKRYWTLPQARLSLASLVLTFGFYFFVKYDQGHGWGYRYIHPVWGLLPIFAAMSLISRSPSSEIQGTGTLVSGSRLQLFGSLALWSLLVMVPLQAWQVRQFMQWHLDHRLTAEASPNQVVFVWAPEYANSGDLIQNTPLKERAIYMISDGLESDAALMSAVWPGARKVREDLRGSVWEIH